MTVKEFLISSPFINVTAVAKVMYPGNSDAASYLLRKLGDKGRPFTIKDSEKALEALKQLGEEIEKLDL